MAGEIEAVVFQRVQYGQIRVLAAFFRFVDGGLGRYLAVIGQIIGDTTCSFKSPQLVEVLADVDAGLLLLASGERTPALAKGGAKSRGFSDDAQYLLSAGILGACR